MIRSSYGKIDRVKKSFKEKGRTVQYFKDEVDINNIMDRYRAGEAFINKQTPQFGDFSEVTDYRSALDAVRQADAAFQSLPSNIRAYFEHDPQKMVDFCEDSDNLEELRRLGLAPEAQQIPDSIQDTHTTDGG